LGLRAGGGGVGGGGGGGVGGVEQRQLAVKLFSLSAKGVTDLNTKLTMARMNLLTL
jgi:hypothetical protein